MSARGRPPMRFSEGSPTRRPTSTSRARAAWWRSTSTPGQPHPSPWPGKGRRERRPSWPAVGSGQSIDVQVTGVGGVPATGVAAAILNVTVTQPTANGYLTVYPAGSGRPLASNLNFVAGQTVPNLVEVALGTGGKVSAFNFT